MTNQLTGRLCKAARALTGWNQAELAQCAHLSKQTIADFERGARTPYLHSLAAIRHALESAGVRIMTEAEGGPGIRLATPGPAQTAGTSGLFDAPVAQSPAGATHRPQDSQQTIARYEVAAPEIVDVLRRAFQEYRLPESAQHDMRLLLEVKLPK